MEFKPETVQALLFTLSALGGGLLVGGLSERLFLTYLRRRQKSARATWEIWRGLGWFTGAWIALRIVLAQSFLPVNWHDETALIWKIAGILIGMVYLGRLAGRLVKDNTSEVAGVLPAVSLLNYVARGIVYLSGALIILQAFDISITPMVTALGVGGLAVALALQDTLSNLFAGIQIIASRKIEPGQFIRLDGAHEGTVVDINWRNTILVNQSNMLIIVPNKTLSSSIVTNTHLPDGEVSVFVEGTVDFSTDLEFVERILSEEAQRIQQTHREAVQDHQPTVRFQALASSGVGFQVALRARSFDGQSALKHSLIMALHRRFREHGVPVKTLSS